LNLLLYEILLNNVMCDHDIISLGTEILVLRLFRMYIVCGFDQ